MRTWRVCATLGFGLGLCLALAWVMQVGAPGALADTHTVCSSGCDFTSIQAAVSTAAAGDTIHILTGTYTENVTISKTLTLQGDGPGLTIVDGGHAATAFTITGQYQPSNVANVSILDMTIQNGVAGNHGGGILYTNIGHSSQLISNTAILSNTSGAGGAGIFCDNIGEENSLTINGSLFRNNAADASPVPDGELGGAISYNGRRNSLTINDTRVISNFIGYPGNPGDGAALGIGEKSTQVTINRTQIIGNEAGNGGAIYVPAETATLTIRDSVLDYNTAHGDGGVARLDGDGGSIIIINSDLSHNTASDGSGVLRIDGDRDQVSIISSTLDYNTAQGERGGVMETTGPGGVVTITGSLLRHNTADQWGGAVNVAGGYQTVTVISSTLSQNSATYGGGVEIENISGGTGHHVVQFVASAILSNTAQGAADSSGGGIDLVAPASVVTMTNTTLSGNEATGSGWGGGLNLDVDLGDDPTTIYLNNVTVAHNTSSSNGDNSGAGGLFVVDAVTLHLANTIIANNQDNSGVAPDCARDPDGQLVSHGYNLVGDSTGCSWTAGTGDLVGTGGSPIDPELDPLTGAPGYYPLRLDSPAVNAGNPDPVGGAFPACAAVDQPGQTRLTTRCDIGAFELPLFMVYEPLVVRQ